MTSAGFHQLDPGWADCLALLTLLPWPLLIVLGKETDASQANQTSLSSDLEIGLRGTELPGAELPLGLDTWSKDLRIPRRLPELHWFLLFLTLSCSSLPMTLLSCSRVLLQVLAFTSFFCLSQNLLLFFTPNTLSRFMLLPFLTILKHWMLKKPSPPENFFSVSLLPLHAGGFFCCSAFFICTAAPPLSPVP